MFVSGGVGSLGFLGVFAMSDFTPPPPEVVAAETALSLAADDASRAWSAWEDAEAKLSLAEDALRAACEAAGYPPSACPV